MHKNGTINSPSVFSFLKMAKRHLFFYVLCTACLTFGTLFILEYNGKYSVYSVVSQDYQLNFKNSHQMESQDNKSVRKHLQSMKTKGSQKSGKEKIGKEKKTNSAEKFGKIKFLGQEKQQAQLSKEDSEKAVVLTRLSEQFQRELHELQNPKSCTSGKFLQCGYEEQCGLGCTFHNHMGCLMFSYAMKIPLIHNARKGWSYRDPWSKYFHSFGSKCKISKNKNKKNNSKKGNKMELIQWNWSKMVDNKSVESHIFKQGFPVPRKFGQELMKVHENPALWMIGQFIQSAFHVKDQVLKGIEEYEKSLGILNEEGKRAYPLIGMHVRRTDKFKETKFVFTPKDFMNAATEFRAKWTEEQNLIPFKNSTSRNLESISRHPWKIFIASEDYRVISNFRQKFVGTPWEFVGDESSHLVLKNPHSRMGHLYEIVRDILVLSHCDYVICTVSSNVCRLLVDIAGLTRLHPSRHFKLFEGSYKYKLHSKKFPLELKLLDE